VLAAVNYKNAKRNIKDMSNITLFGSKKWLEVVLHAGIKICRWVKLFCGASASSAT
jgi:hypothetical protein